MSEHPRRGFITFVFSPPLNELVVDARKSNHHTLPKISPHHRIVKWIGDTNTTIYPVLSREEVNTLMKEYAIHVVRPEES